MARLMTESEVALRLGVTTRTLQNWRRAGTGPPHMIIGMRTVRYHSDQVAEYERSRTVSEPSFGAGALS